MPIRSRHLPRTAVVALAVLLPLITCFILSATRGFIENTNAGLILVLVVVAAASTGSRPAGLTAAAVSAVGFDFFLTAPYYQLRIDDRDDIVTAVLLLLIGAAVSELALWGRRQQARASEQRGYLDGLLETTQSVAESASAETLTQHVQSRLIDLLGLDSASYIRSIPSDTPILQPDGTLVHQGRPIDVQRLGLPTDTEIILPIGSRDGRLGAFRLVAATHVARPSIERCRVAAALAAQVGKARQQEANL